MSDTLIGLVAAEARGAISKDTPLAANVEAAMRVAANHWMVLDRDLQLKGALAALLLEYPETTPEGERLRHEVAAMRKLSGMIHALQSGVPVGLEAMAAEPTPEYERVGIADAWRKVTA